MGVHVTAASVGERAGAKQMLESVKDELPRLRSCRACGKSGWMVASMGLRLPSGPSR